MTRLGAAIAMSAALMVLPGSVPQAAAQAPEGVEDAEGAAGRPDMPRPMGTMHRPGAGMTEMMDERDGAWRPHAMRRGDEGHPMMGGMMMRMMFALMDADGDGSISREEWLEAHERIFNHLDREGDGQVTPEDMRAFMTGRGFGTSPGAAPDAEDGHDEDAAN